MSRLYRFLDRFPIAPALILLTLAVYWRAQYHWFAYDDAQYIFGTKHIRSGLNLADIKWAFTTHFAANWHPLTWISYMMDTQAFGMSARAFHLTNILLHAASVFLLFLVLSRMTRSEWKSAFVAALFAIHPLHVESVAWIAERKDVLSGFFFMLTLWAYAGYAERPAFRRYALVVLCFALGLMSKPMLVTLPFVLLLLDYWPLARLRAKSGTGVSFGRLVLEKVPLFAMSAVSSVVTYSVQSKGGAFGAPAEFPFGIRAMNALVSYIAYIGKTIWPSKLAVLYPHPGPSLPIWKAVAAGILLIAITILVLRAARRKPFLAVGWLWYLGTLVPVIGLVQVGVQAMADRYTYLPLIGLFIMLAWGIPGSMGVWEYGSTGGETPPHPHTPTHPHAYRLSVQIAAVVAILALGPATWHQIGYWQDNATLFRHTAAVTKDNYDAYINLGAALQGTGKYEEALDVYLRAERLRPNHAPVHYNIGGVLAPMGRYEEAIAEYEKALKLEPRYPDVHCNLAVVLVKKGRYQEALKHYKEALRIYPDYADAHSNLGSLLDIMGRTKEALAHYDAAIAANPDYPEAHYNKAVALQKLKRFRDAADEYRLTIRMQPGFVPAHRNLAVTLYFSGDYRGAWNEVHEMMRLGAEINPDFLAALARKMPEPH